MAETVEYVLDENGERIRVEHKHEGHPSTWSYKTRPLTDDTWRKFAVEIMEEYVEVYDQYLRGDVYGFELYEEESVEDAEDPDWNEIDSCWGFYGSDIMENGICDQVGCGLEEAIESGHYEEGEAVVYATSRYLF